MPDLLVTLDRSRAGLRAGLAEQLTEALREAIADGRLAAGTRLPSSRELAGQLGVSRGLVVAAYEQLTAEGRLVARRGAGTVVSSLPGPRPGPSMRSGTPTVDDHVPKFMTGGGLLRPGVPDLALFPRAVWRRAYESVLRTVADADLGYGDPSGAPRLREELAGYLGRVRAARVDPAAMVVTTGAAQAFTVLAQALRRGMEGQGWRVGDRIGVEDPGSPVIRDHLRAGGLVPVPVPVDEAGLDVAALDRTGVAAVFVTPAHQYPTGVVLAPERRAALVEWARGRAGVVIEDDYDAEFRYDREPVGCLQGVAPDVVALVGSASKALAPALRLGWLAVPPRLMAGVTRAKDHADHGGPALEQLAFAELLATGGYDRHLRAARRAYRGRRDAVLAALDRHLPRARVAGVAAGLHLVVELPATIDDAELVARAAAEGLGPWPLSALRVAGSGPPGLVVGYGGHSPDELAGAIRRLAALVR
jgi:GntR family transcriptional regulator/MocR family aminotransferase